MNVLAIIGVTILGIWYLICAAMVLTMIGGIVYNIGWNIHRLAEVDIVNGRDFCVALEIEKPVVMGTSFGGHVAMAYTTRHPDRPGKLILCAPSAK